jgi:hypothetical protein
METVQIYEIPAPDWSERISDFKFRRATDGAILSFSSNLHFIVPSSNGVSFMYEILRIELNPLAIITREKKFEIHPTSVGRHLTDYLETMRQISIKVTWTRRREEELVNPQGLTALGNPTMW